MAKTTSFLSQTSGKLDNQFQTRQTDHGTFLARLPRKANKKRRTEKQANTRCQLPNAAANYTLYSGKLKEAFEGKNAGVSDYNAFIQANYGKNPVFITKQESQSGACVLGNYLYSRGSLAAIGSALQDGKLVSNLKLGALVIGAGTTVGEFSAALIANNADWKAGDQITLFYAEQWMDSEGVPRATMEAWKVVLDTEDDTLLWGVVMEAGFASVAANGGYVLGMSKVLQNAGASWVHSRNKSDSSTQVSTQRMRVVSDILGDYQGYDAMMASAMSYGGITAKDVYLNPGGSFGDLVTTGGNGGSESENAPSGNGGLDQGGGSGQTVTVAAPVISGTTPFAERTTVSISGPEGADVYYTVGGSEPTVESTLYASAITLTDTTTVKAIAIMDGVSSEVASKTFTKNAGGESGDAE